MGFDSLTLAACSHPVRGHSSDWAHRRRLAGRLALPRGEVNVRSMTVPTKEIALSAPGESARAARVKAVVAVDETNLRDELRETLAALSPALAVCAMATDGIDALLQFAEHRPDILFLGIQMPGVSGLG